MARERIYYVGARLSWESSVKCGLDQLGHATLIYSRKWFPYRQAAFFPLIIEPPYDLDVFGDGINVLRFFNQRLFERHIELRNVGAGWDYDDFKAHITLRTPVSPDTPLTFTHEYYQTWEQDVR